MGERTKLPGMVEALREAVLVKKMPFFGICVGTQILAFARVSFDEKLWSAATTDRRRSVVFRGGTAPAQRSDLTMDQD